MVLGLSLGGGLAHCQNNKGQQWAVRTLLVPLGRGRDNWDRPREVRWACLDRWWLQQGLAMHHLLQPERIVFVSQPWSLLHTLTPANEAHAAVCVCVYW